MISTEQTQASSGGDVSKQHMGGGGAQEHVQASDDMVQKCQEYIVESNKAELREARGHYLCGVKCGRRGELYSGTPGDRCHADVRRAWVHESSELEKAYPGCSDYIRQNWHKFKEFMEEHQEGSAGFKAIVQEIETISAWMTIAGVERRGIWRKTLTFPIIQRWNPNLNDRGAKDLSFQE